MKDRCSGEISLKGMLLLLPADSAARAVEAWPRLYGSPDRPYQEFTRCAQRPAMETTFPDEAVKDARKYRRGRNDE